MLIKISWLFFALVSLLYSQKSINTIIVEHHSLMKDSNQVEFFSYKIPFSKLVFNKENNHYTAPYSLTFEIYKDNEFVLREIQTSSATTFSYDETTSGEIYIEDLFTLEIPPGEYSLKTSLRNESSGSDYISPNLKLKIDDLKISRFVTPIVVNDTRNTAKHKDKYELVNFGHQIPFSPNKFSLVLGILDSSIQNIKVTITQLDVVVFADSITNYNTGNLNLLKEKKKIILDVDTNFKMMNIFTISNFSHLLLEGKAELVIKFGTKEEKIPLNIVWFNKPKVLHNPEYAIKLLSYIEDKDAVSKMLRTNKKYYFRTLLKYWNEHYPANGMKYNYAMKEYYSRADYAIENFSTLNTFNGAETDRGKIYITYGKPTSIDRNYTEKNDIIEVWYYKKIDRTFIFKDVNGTGKFDLVE